MDGDLWPTGSRAPRTLWAPRCVTYQCDENSPAFGEKSSSAWPRARAARGRPTSPSPRRPRASQVAGAVERDATGPRATWRPRSCGVGGVAPAFVGCRGAGGRRGEGEAGRRRRSGRARVRAEFRPLSDHFRPAVSAPGGVGCIVPPWTATSGPPARARRGRSGARCVRVRRATRSPRHSGRSRRAPAPGARAAHARPTSPSPRRPRSAAARRETTRRHATAHGGAARNALRTAPSSGSCRRSRPAARP